MSARYSNLPALHLPIGNSLSVAVLATAFYACLIATPFLELAPRGLLLASAAAALAVVLLLERRRRFSPSALFHTGSAQWSVHRGVQVVRVVPRGNPTLLPWLVFLPFRQVGSGAHCDVWVFRDAVTPGQWRQLRVRATTCWCADGA